MIAFGGYTYVNNKKAARESMNSEVTPELQKMMNNTPSINDGERTAFTGTKELDTQKSTFNWTAQKSVLKNWIDTGIVKASSGNILFDNGKVVGGEVMIDMNSITAKTTGSGGGQEKLTSHVKSADFFDVGKYPTAKIVVKEVTGGNAKGDLTIKGITKSIEFPITVTEKMGMYTVVGKLTIDRSMFDVKFGSTSFIKDLGDKAIDNNFTIDFFIVAE